MSNAVPPSTGSEPQARPKVMRRPPQFSRKPEIAAPLAAAPISTADPLPAMAPPAAPRASFQPGWQEDGRFGVLVIACLLLFNILLAFTLANIPHRTADRGPATVTLMNNASMPSAIRRPQAANVTVYSEPKLLSESSSMDLENLPEEHNDFSVSPRDVPAPTARALDE